MEKTRRIMFKTDVCVKVLWTIVGILNIIFICRTFQTDERIIHFFSFGTFETNVNKIQLGIEENKVTLPKGKTLLTLFTSWDDHRDKYMCRNNTIKNWNLLRDNVTSILFTNDTNLSRRVTAMGWNVLPIKKVGKTGVPVLKDMYYAAFSATDSLLYAYVNGDILFTDDLIETIKAVLETTIGDSDDLLLIGRRCDVRNVTSEEAQNYGRLRETMHYRGKLHNSWGMDYFIMKKSYPLRNYPNLVIGRPLVDTYLVSEAVNRPHSHVIDITKTSPAIHQVTLPGKVGIREGMSKSDNLYNFKLLASTKWNQFSGLTICTPFFTTVNGDLEIIIKKRKREEVVRKCRITKMKGLKIQKTNTKLKQMERTLKELNLSKRNRYTILT